MLIPDACLSFGRWYFEISLFAHDVILYTMTMKCPPLYSLHDTTCDVAYLISQPILLCDQPFNSHAQVWRDVPPSSLSRDSVMTRKWFPRYWLFVNPLRAKLFRGDINIYSHFVSFLHIDAMQVVEILPQIRQEPNYSTESISWLLMSWRRKEPWHQQTWYWPS